MGGGWSNNAISTGTVCVGGTLNVADSQYSTVGGGQNNSTSNAYATITGGQSNIASGKYSAVSGGVLNLASGNYSFAVGRRARAVNAGAFVWADSTNSNFSSTAVNQFSVRSSGGVRIYTNDTLGAGVTMGAGASSWTSVSDKSVKKDFREINSDELLKKLSEIPISRWKYIAEQSQADHIGPMSQDFYQAFGLGDDDKRISTIDADGVALVAIQALHKQNLELKKELEDLKKLVESISTK